MKKHYFFMLLALLSLNSLMSQTIDPSQWPGMVGYWNFDDSLNLTHATVGNDLELFGTDQAVPGPIPGDGATRIGVGDHYKCTHGISPNGGGSYVNEYTLVIDFKIPQLGQYYCFYQTNTTNSNDGEVFINPTGHVGITTTGYSYCVLTPNEWYRLVISVDLGSSFNYYIDGQLIHEGISQSIDGNFSLDQFFHWFWDDNAEDNEFDIAAAAILNYPMTADEVEDMGGYGHFFPEPPVDYMNPYLQTVTTSSVYICWHADDISSSIVEYGTDASLGQHETGTYENISGKKWHTVQLTGLLPNTEYFYHCISGSDTSEISSFRTKKEPGTADSHVRFVIVGDTRTDSYMIHYISEAIEEQLISDYGENWQNEVDFVINVGDIVETGSAINQYTDQYFLPYSNLTDKIPFYVSIGNHEMENPIYYKYMKYEEMTGAPYDPPSPYNEKFYAFRYGNCQFIALNSNTPYQIQQQTDWLENILDSCETDPQIEFIFTLCHHPGHTEVWPDGNTAYIQDEIIPLLKNYSKPAMLIYGHTHAYEHGTAELDQENSQYKNDMHLLLAGGGGSPLDRWGMYANQQNYAEIFKSLDHYEYSIVDVDIDNKAYFGRTYSFGHPDKLLNNELVDVWYSKRDQPRPEKPVALDPYQENDTLIFQGSAFDGVDSLMTSQIQITTEPGNFSNPAVDKKRDIMNIYGDSGAPDYTPVDLNEGIDITRLEIPSAVFPFDTYGWRIRYRDHNLKWSEWSDEKVFTITDVSKHSQNNNSFKVSPNPFNKEINFSFSVFSDEVASLTVYNSENKKIETIFSNKKFAAGKYSFKWKPEANIKPGVYFCKLVLGDDILTAKIIYSK